MADDVEMTDTSTVPEQSGTGEPSNPATPESGSAAQATEQSQASAGDTTTALPDVPDAPSLEIKQEASEPDTELTTKVTPAIESPAPLPQSNEGNNASHDDVEMNDQPLATTDISDAHPAEESTETVANTNLDIKQEPGVLDNAGIDTKPALNEDSNLENGHSEKQNAGYLDDVNVDDEDIDMDFKENNAGPDYPEDTTKPPTPQPQPLPQFTRKDKTLLEFLNSMDQYAPIIPDAVTDYYLAKSGFESSDLRIKRLLALATQKFISDIASDAYQYSRIRSASSVSSSSNPQARAKALMAGMAGPTANANASSGPNATGQPTPATTGGGMSSSNQGKLVLTMEDLGSALAEYGLNVRRPDFYR